MTTASVRRTGRLFDLGPDGLGFIIPSDDPDSMIAFMARRRQSRSVEVSGLREGDRVEFQLNDQLQVDEIRLIS